MAVPAPFILALTGTSLTTGRLSSDWRATLLQDLRDQPEAVCPIEVYDLGKGGWTSTDILANAPVLSALKPTHILFEGGAINSCVDTGGGPALSRAAHIANVVAMINEWRTNVPGVDLTLQTMSGIGVVNTIRPQLASYYADEIATAAAQSIGSLNNYANWPSPIYTSRTFNADGLHPVWKNAVDTYLYPYVLFWARQKLAAKFGLSAPTWVAPAVPAAPVLTMRRTGPGSAGSFTAQSYGYSATGLPDTDFLYWDFPMSTGKWYWEYKLTSANYHMTGITRSPTTPLTWGGYSTLNAGIYQSSPWMESAWGTPGSWAVAAPGVGDTLGFAYDADARVLKVYRNNVLATTFGAAGTGGSGGSSPMYPMFAFQSGPSAEMRVGAGLTYTPPSGYASILAF